VTDELTNAIVDLREDDALATVDRLLEEGADPVGILTDCKKAMDVIGGRFACGEAFIPELIMAGEIMTGIAGKLKPHLAGAPTEKKLGTVVLGTVAGDIHDIGKDIVGTMLDIAGFEVVDLGVDVSVEAFISTAREAPRAGHRHELPAHQRYRVDEEHGGRRLTGRAARPGQADGRRCARHRADRGVHRRRRLRQGRRGGRRACQAVDRG
jgi:hypothetical protein